MRDTELDTLEAQFGRVQEHNAHSEERIMAYQSYCEDLLRTIESNEKAVMEKEEQAQSLSMEVRCRK